MGRNIISLCPVVSTDRTIVIDGITEYVTSLCEYTTEGTEVRAKVNTKTVK